MPTTYNEIGTYNVQIRVSLIDYPHVELFVIANIVLHCPHYSVVTVIKPMPITTITYDKSSPDPIIGIQLSQL